MFPGKNATLEFCNFNLLRNQCFVVWITDFSTDAKADVIQDAKFKQREALKQLNQAMRKYSITIPSSSMSVESAIINASADQVWKRIRPLVCSKLSTLFHIVFRVIDVRMD